MEETPKLSTKVKLNEQEYKITDFENGKKICLKGTEEENINDDIAISRGKEDTIMTYHSRIFGNEFKEYGGVAIKKPKDGEQIMFRIESEARKDIWREEKWLQYTHEFIREDVKALLDAEKLLANLEANPEIAKRLENELEKEKDKIEQGEEER